MARFVAFLQGVNLGATRKVPMATLREVLADQLGYADLVTFLNSGNVAYDATGSASSHEKAIEEALGVEFGFEVPTFVRSAKDVAALVKRDPFSRVKKRPGDQVFVTFLKKKPSATAAKAVAAMSNDEDRLVVDGRELWHLRRGPLMESTLPKGGIDAADLGPHTTRNRNTLEKIAGGL